MPLVRLRKFFSSLAFSTFNKDCGKLFKNPFWLNLISIRLDVCRTIVA